MERTFVETEFFKRLVDQEEDPNLEREIKDEILRFPNKGDLIQGTGGLRKIRIKRSGSGKSGGYRVIYLDLPQYSRTYLMLFYPKNVGGNISAKMKNLLAKETKRIKDGCEKNKKD